MKILLLLVSLTVSVWLPGCGKAKIDAITSTSTILAFGDSLTSGTGAKPDESYPSILKKLIGCEVVNGGVPGDDTSAGLKRLPMLLKRHNPDLVLLCLGGNDMLRKHDSRLIKENLKTMMQLIQKTKADIILIGVPKPGLLLKVPAFYKELAAEFNVPVDMDIVQTILSNAALKSDYIHPNANGYAGMARSIHALITQYEK